MPEFYIILVEPRYQGNIGAVARVMKNFGFHRLILVNPPELSGEAMAMAMHAHDILRNAEILERFDDLIERFDFLVATSAEIASDKNPMRTPVFPEELENSTKIKGKIGLVFGREDYGLFNDEISKCDILVSIPTSGEYRTMNLSHAVAVILYELSRREMMGKIARMKKFERADGNSKRILLEKFDRFVDLIHDNEFTRKLTKKTFRQLIGRAFISGREASNLIGLFRRANERLES
ncbi:MAG: RNA methyltransferase [Candidatus Altiarchaeales archaeon]|nr:MAG: RNA methyltransferase [Candidatus Altiarchaeales archaeon]